MAYGAKGVARHEGKVYFIADAVVGDQVEVEVVSDSGRYADAVVRRLIKPSDLRGHSACKYATDCGGCQWLGIAYAEQLEWKRSFVVSALTRIGKLDPSLPVSITAAPSTLHYRNRILVRLHLKERGELKLGYFRRQSRDLVPIDACAIAAPAINHVLSALQTMPVEGLSPFTVRLELQEIPATGQGRVVVTVYPGDGDRKAISDFTARLGRLADVHWAGLVFDLKHAPEILFEEDLGRSFHTRPGQFQQVNLALNHALRRLVLEHVERLGASRILDVFCGSGNLSIPLANGARYVEGVEANRDAIHIAKYNAEANGLSGVLYLAGDAEKHLWKVSRGGEVFDLVILDPPRQGFHKGVVPLKKLSPKHIIYVSCDPTTLARDLAYLCRNDHYKVSRVEAFDFFPNTYHVETVAFLDRTSAADPECTLATDDRQG